MGQLTLVARFEKLGRVLTNSHTSGSAGCNDISRPDRATIGYDGDQFRNREDEIVCGSVLALLPVHKSLHA